MLKAFKTRLRVNETQARLLAQLAGTERWAYNSGLALINQSIAESGKAISVSEAMGVVRANKPDWVLSAAPIAAARANLINAVNRFHDCRKGKHNWHKPGECGWPNFHSRARHDGFEAYDGHPERIRWDGNRKVYIPGVGFVRMAEPLPGVSFVKRVFCKRKSGKWWVVFLVEDGVAMPESGSAAGSAVGVDVGIKTLAMVSDGREFANPKPLKAAERRLRKLDKAIARSKKVHGKDNPSNRRKRLYLLRQKAHERVANIRQSAHRNAASAIAKTAGAVVVESLNIKGMMRNRKLAKALADAAMGGFLRELAWQCQKRGVVLVEAGAWFPSTQKCARCGSKPDKKLDLSIREYRCGVCGWVCDRDRNAAINLQQLAPPTWSSLKARGVRVSPRSGGAVGSEAQHQSPAGPGTITRQPMLSPGW